MAAGTEIGSAWVSILPDMRGVIGGVTKGMKTASASASKTFTAGMGKNLSGVSKAFSEAGKDAGEALAKSALSAAKSDIAKLSKQVATATDAQANALGRLRVAQTKLDEVRANSKAKVSQIAAAEEGLATAQRKANVATGAAKGFTEKLAAAQARAKTATEDLTKAQAETAKAGAKSGNFFTNGFKAAFKPKETVAAELRKVDGTNEGRGLATRFGKGFTGGFAGVAKKSAALLAATLATVGVGSLVKDSVNLEATFSQTMNTMAAVAKVPQTQVKELSALALKMGADTSFSAGEAATAMLELSKGGLTAATIQSGALAGTLTLAAAGGTSLETAATIAGNALNTFQLQGKDMAVVASALAGGANASTASIESLGEALGQVGPGARTAGLDLNDTVGVLAAFDNAGIKGSDAGTSLKTMLTRLVPQTKAARTAMKDLGLKFTDASGKFLPITNVAEQLRLKLGKLSAEQRTTALTTIFGSDATRAATVLMNEGSVGIGKYITATKDQNAANEIAAARMSGTAGAIEQFKGSLESAKIRLGQFLAPAVQAGLGFLTDKINGLAPAVKTVASAVKNSSIATAFQTIGTVAGKVFTEVTGSVRAFISSFKANDGDITSSGLPGFFERLGFTARQVFDAIKNDVIPTVVTVAGNIKNDLLPPVVFLAQKLGDVAGAIVSAVGPAFTAFGGFLSDNKTLVGSLTVGILAIATAIKVYRVAMTVAAAVGKAFAVVQLAISAAMNANPISIIALALIGLVAGLVYAYRNSERFRDVVNGALNGVKGVALTVFGALKTGIGALVTAFNATKEAIGVAIGAVVTAFNAVKTAVSATVGFVAGVWNTIAGILMTPVNLFIAGLKVVWPYIYPILVLPFKIAETVIGGIWNLIKAGFTAARDFVVGVFAKAWNAVAGVLGGPINEARARIVASFALVRAAFTSVKDWVVNAFSKAWAVTTRIVSLPINLALNLIRTAWTNISNAFTAAKNFVTGAFSKAWSLVTQKLAKPILDAKAAVGAALGAAKGGIQWVFSQAVSAVGKIWDGLMELAKKPIRFIINTVLNDGLISAFNWVAGKFDAPKIPNIPLPKGFASGGHFDGRLPGRPSAVDNMLGMTSKGAVGLATGEFVVNAKDTARALPFLKHVNDGGDVPGFAGGGLFGKLKNGITSAFNKGKEIGSDVFDVLKDPAKWIKSKLAGPLGRIRELGTSPFVETVKAVPKKLVDVVAGKAKSILGGLDLNLGGGGTFPGPPGSIRNFRGEPLNNRTINMILAAERLLSGHKFTITQGSYKRATSYSGTTHTGGGVFDSVMHPVFGAAVQALRKVGFAAWDRTGKGNWAPHIHAVAGGDPTASASAKAQYQDYLRGGDGLANGGLVKSVLPRVPVFDNGGIVRPGLNLINNLTGADEELRPKKGDTPAVINIYDVDGKLWGSMKGIAKAEDEATATRFAHEFQL